MRKTKYLFSLKDYIEDLKRTRLSEYCLNGCPNYCCTKLTDFKIKLNNNQIFLLYEKEFNQTSKASKQKFIESKISELSSKNLLIEKGNGICWFFGPDCPRYDYSTKKCEIHKNPYRPSDCADFPIHFTQENMTLAMDIRCSFIGKNLKEIFYGMGKKNIEKMQKNEIFVNIKGIPRMNMKRSPYPRTSR